MNQIKEAIKYILGGKSITVYLDGKTFAVNKEASTFNLVVDAVRSNDIDKLRQAVNVRDYIVSALKVKSDKIRVTENTIWYGEREITGLVATRVFEVIRLGLDVQPMVCFLENLMDNPSKRAVDELFGFLEACNLPITNDGHFLAYKRVRDNYKDVHTGTFDNSVGQVLSMLRNLVDEDKDRTCSSGLHFCSYDYLSSFGGERIMVLKINPKDVVAIPSDYNNSKGRTSSYTVVDELDVNDYNSMPTTKIKEDYTTDYGSDNFDDDDEYNGNDDDEVTVVDSRGNVTMVNVGCGDSGGFAKGFTDSQRDAIRNAINNRGASLTELAKLYNTSVRTIGRIRDGHR